MYWISVEPTTKSANQLTALRSKLVDRVGSQVYSEETYEHITLVPGFVTQEPMGENLLDDFSTPITVTFDSYHIWPSVENPMVVALSTSEASQLTTLREEALRFVDSKNGTLEYEPKPFHLTLFKGGDSGDEDSFAVESSAKDEIESIVAEKDGLPITVTFESVQLKIWNS